MALILQDVMLEKLRCSNCEKYLSVLPVKVYPDGSTKCGRCSDSNDNGTVSLYGTVIQKYLFKCVNRYEGCNKLLSPIQVLPHEKVCICGRYTCPKCEKCSGSVYELLQHYKNHHTNSILKKNMFQIATNQVVKERYLYLVQNNMFFVLVENMPNEKCLYLSAVSIKPCINVKQHFSIKPLGNFTANTKTKITPCSSLESFRFDYFKIETKHMSNKLSCSIHLDLSQHINFVNEVSLGTNRPRERVSKKKIQDSKSIQTMPMEDVYGVKLTNTFKEAYPHYRLTPCGTALFNDENRIELTCSNCRNFTGSNVFNCRDSIHLVCWECNAWCGICNSPVGGWDAEVSSVNELLLLPCRWKCGRNFSGDKLRNHEATCVLHIKRCPEGMCPLTEVHVTNLKIHLLQSHNIEFLSQFNLSSHLKGNSQWAVLYFAQNDFLFRCEWEKFHNTYEILLKPMENVNDYELAVIFDNKTYKKLINDKISFTLDNNPKFYLKRIK